MIPEWDYSHAKQKGKNIFFLRDTDHTSEEVQESILGELDRLVDQHFFSTLFIEGFEGLCLPRFDGYSSEEELKRSLQERYARWSPVQLFAYRHQTALNLGQVSIYGVDNITLVEEHQKNFQRVLELCDKVARGESLTQAETEERRWRKDVNHKIISEKRNIFSVCRIVELMRSVDTAGLVYGNGHFPGIVAGLDKLNIGYVSFFPGEVEFDPEKAKDYVRRFT